MKAGVEENSKSGIEGGDAKKKRLTSVFTCFQVWSLDGKGYESSCKLYKKNGSFGADSIVA